MGLVCPFPNDDDIFFTAIDFAIRWLKMANRDNCHIKIDRREKTSTKRTHDSLNVPLGMALLAKSHLTARLKTHEARWRFVSRGVSTNSLNRGC